MCKLNKKILFIILQNLLNHENMIKKLPKTSSYVQRTEKNDLMVDLTEKWSFLGF